MRRRRRFPGRAVLLRSGWRGEACPRRRAPSCGGDREPLDGCSWEGDLDAETAVCAGLEFEAACVRGGDGGDDRQPAPVAVLRSGSVLPEAFELFGELRNGFLVEHRAAAVDHHSRPMVVKPCEPELDR